MKGLDRRITALERQAGCYEETITVLIRNFVYPGPAGPEDSGASTAIVVAGPHKGLRLDRADGETKEAFEMRLDALVGE